MNRIVLFADVHGNITGLEAIMNEVKKLENVTHIIGLGDYFGWGAGCNDIIELCKANDVILIRGGHEEILNIIDREGNTGYYYPEIYLCNYTIIEYDEEKVAIIQRQVPYDKAEEDRLVEERGMMRRLK